MLRINRGKFIGIVCLTVFIYFLVFTETGSSTSNFRSNTEAGIARKADREKDLPLRGSLSDEDLTRKTNDELQGILNSHSQERLAKDANGVPLGRKPQEPAHNPPSRADLDNKGMSREDPKPRPIATAVKSPVAATSKAAGKTQTSVKTEDEEEKDATSPVQGKLDEYLKAPLVIFSKSYCPHSKKAKHLLLEVYNIKPKPVVVELDELTSTVEDKHDEEGHSRKTVGAALQELLAEMTSRRTVPNIVVGGKHSIGGNDNIWLMHESGTLQEEILKYGGKKITSIELRNSEV